MKPRKSFLLRLNPDLYEAIESWAGQEMRSVNGQIEYILKETVRKRGKNISDDDAQCATGSASAEKHFPSDNC